jgi:hypothetical protein
MKFSGELAAKLLAFAITLVNSRLTGTINFLTDIAVRFYTLTSVIYNIVFHPLRKVPGPWIAKVSPVSFPVLSLRFF